jgi:hypothetical protein
MCFCKGDVATALYFFSDNVRTKKNNQSSGCGEFKGGWELENKHCVEVYNCEVL